MAKDPVCGMMVNEKEAPATSEHGGRTYYFCSAECKLTFDQSPEMYARRAS
jgi:YHS domain-containing protein